jgi:hypothetical protein
MKDYFSFFISEKAFNSLLFLKGIFTRDKNSSSEAYLLVFKDDTTFFFIKRK